LKKIERESETLLFYCPFSVFEDLKEKFEFVKKDESDLYKLIIQLPFLESKDDLEARMKELLNIKFN
jgi:hypothetical protein